MKWKKARDWTERSGNWRQWRKFEWNEWWTERTYLFFRFSFSASSFLWYCCRRKWEIWFDSNSYTIHPNSPVYTSFTLLDSWHSSCSIASIYYTIPCNNVPYSRDSIMPTTAYCFRWNFEIRWYYEQFQRNDENQHFLKKACTTVWT